MRKKYSLIFGMIALTFSFLTIVNNVNAQLYINEFMASNDNAFAGPQGDYPDWIEIYNAGTEAVMLGGYYLCDDLTDVTARFQIPDTYPDSVTVPAGGFILFYANKGEESSVLNLDFKLSGGGEQIGLWDPNQNFIDSLTYYEQITDTSYGRYPDGSNNWYFMSDFTPGASNIHTSVNPQLYINEFMASNDNAFAGLQGDYPDWIEIYNAGTEAVMLGGYYLCDDLTDTTARFQIPDIYPDSVTVPAGGFILFYANKGEESSVLNLNFKLSGGGEQIGLWDPEQNFIDSLTYYEQITDTSYGRYPDGSNNWYFMSDFTPGEPNANTMAINENKINIALLQNYPNPFSNETTIEFVLNKPDHVQICIFDITGSLITVLEDKDFTVGKHSIKWDSSKIPSGLYFYSIITSSNVVVKKATKI